MTEFFRDTWLVYMCTLTLTRRNPLALFIALAQPIAFLLLFAPMWMGAMGMAESDVYRLYVPGLVIQMAAFTTLFVGIGLVGELRSGVIERMRVTPVSRTALLLGRALRDITVVTLQSTLLILVAIAVGLRVGPAALLMVFGLMAMVALTAAAASYGLAIVLRSETTLASLANLVSLPMLLLSGILIPMAFAPSWLQGLAEVNPVYYGVEAARQIVGDHATAPVVWQALVILGVLGGVAVFWSTRLFARAVR